MRLADERDFAEETDQQHAEQMEREKKRCWTHKEELLKKLRLINQGAEQWMNFNSIIVVLDVLHFAP